MPNKIKTARELALECSLEVVEHQLLIPEAMQRLAHQLSDRDRQLANEIVYGTFRYQPGLQTLLLRFVAKPKYPQPIHWVLIQGLYQILFTRLPDYAVINEANRLCERLRMKGLKALVNGVLRRAGREREQILEKMDLVQWLLPSGLRRMYQEQYGAEALARWCQAWSERAAQTYWKHDDQPLEGDQRVEPLPHAIQRNGHLPESLMETSKLYVQNESSQAIAEIVCRLSPNSVLDLCGAPGGKACYVATFAKPERMLVCDAFAERLGLVAENRERLGLDFEMKASAAEDLDVAPDSFDVVMVDAPCSGLGILGRHPEIKFHKPEPTTADFRERQVSLMARGWHFLKPGGYLLFTVCSLDRREVPGFPEGAEVAREQLAEHLVIPHLLHENGSFTIEPSSRFDGFCGVLLRKPSA